jgi:acetyl esterase/lipase
MKSILKSEAATAIGQIPLVTTNLEIPGFAGPIPVRLHRPDNADVLPVVLYFHGGGFVSGSLDEADLPARHISANVPSLVVVVGYSLAPRHPFPAAPEDAYAAACWVATNAKKYKGNAMKLALAGHDAGGNLAASLALIARDRHCKGIVAQALIGPMLDPSMTRLGDERDLKSDLSVATCEQCYREYLPNLLQRVHPYASPLESSRLAGLPPAFIATAQWDVLHIEAEKYAAELIDAGVQTQVERFSGATHSALPTDPRLLNELTHFLRRHLTRTAATSTR